MSRLILLDSGPVGLASHPRTTDSVCRCNAWILERIDDGDRVMIPEIIDYEVRRELLRAGKKRGVARLDSLVHKLGLLPSGGPVLFEAAQLWARARPGGYPTTNNQGLDVDVILAASALLFEEEGYRVVIATTHVGHLGRFANARLWDSIGPEKP